MSTLTSEVCEPVCVLYRLPVAAIKHTEEANISLCHTCSECS